MNFLIRQNHLIKKFIAKKITPLHQSQGIFLAKQHSVYIK